MFATSAKVGSSELLLLRRLSKWISFCDYEHDRRGYIEGRAMEQSVGFIERDNK